METSLSKSEQTEILEILDHWELSPIESMDRVQGNDHIIRVVTTEKAYSLKDAGTKDLDMNRLSFLSDVLEHVSAQGINVAAPIRTCGGEISFSHDGHNYSLLEFVEATGYPKDLGLRNELFYNCGRAIGELHVALASYDNDDLTKRTWQDDPRYSEERTLDMIAKLPTDQTAVIQHIHQDLGKEAAAATDQLPIQLIHRDCHTGNLLVNGTQVAGFIDCDHICIGTPLNDLATYAVHHIKWNLDRPDNLQAWLRALPYLVAGYQSKAELSDHEVRALPHIMMGYHLGMIHWFVSVDARQFIPLEIEAAAWMHENFEAIKQAVVTPVTYGREEMIEI